MIAAEAPFVRRTFEERAQWLTARLATIGASDSALIVLKKGRRVYDAKVLGVEVQSNDQMQLGILIEPAVREACRSILKLAVTDPLPHELCVSNRYPWLSFSPDGWIGEEPLQIKNVGLRSPDLNDVLSEKIPAYMYAQVQQEILVSGASQGHLVCLIGGCQLWHRPIAANENYQLGLIDLLTDWRQRYLIDGEKHPVDSRDETARAIAMTADYEPGSCVTLDGKAGEYAVKIPELEAHRAALDEEIALGKNEIRQALDSHESGISPDGREWYWTRGGKSRQLRSREARG